MLSPVIVEHLDVIEHVLSRLGASFIGPAAYPLPLEWVKEAIRDGAVMAVAAALDQFGRIDALINTIGGFRMAAISAEGLGLPDGCKRPRGACDHRSGNPRHA